MSALLHLGLRRFLTAPKRAKTDIFISEIYEKIVALGNRHLTGSIVGGIKEWVILNNKCYGYIDNFRID